MIVGFTGRKTSGKSEAAKALIESGYKPMSFAAPLKRMVDVFLIDAGLSSVDIRNAKEDKERVIRSLGVSYRHLCQTIGTEWGRHCVASDVWVWLARVAIMHHLTTNPGANIVFDDVRFENEAAMIRYMGGLIVHVNRAGVADDGHVSEAGVVVADEDAVIYNDGPISSLWLITLDAIHLHNARVNDYA